MNQRHASRLVLAAAISASLLAGNACQAQGYEQPSEGTSMQAAHPCNTGAATVIGGLLGALAGRGKGHIAGAAIGAGIGAVACTAYNYHVRKMQDAQQVNAEYQQQHGTLPQYNTVSSYISALQPGNTVQPGGSITLQSTISVVSGTSDAPAQLSERVTLISPDGKSLSLASKQASSINGGGEYQTDFDIDLPKGIVEGNYIVRTQLFMNGRQVDSNDTPMTVVG